MWFALFMVFVLFLRKFLLRLMDHLWLEPLLGVQLDDVDWPLLVSLSNAVDLNHLWEIFLQRFSYGLDIWQQEMVQVPSDQEPVELISCDVVWSWVAWKNLFHGQPIFESLSRGRLMLRNDQIVWWSHLWELCEMRLRLWSLWFLWLSIWSRFCLRNRRSSWSKCNVLLWSFFVIIRIKINILYLNGFSRQAHDTKPFLYIF